MKYIDSHAHYCNRQFKKDRTELLEKLIHEDVELILECGTNTASNEAAIQLSHAYNEVFAVVGISHGYGLELASAGAVDKLKRQLADARVVGLGEIGLDYYRNFLDHATQQKYFRMQLALAREAHLPVCIHSRDAQEDTLAILAEFGPYHGVIHCFPYGMSAMEKLAELGYCFGIGGAATYPESETLREAIRHMPPDRIVLETDAPYLSPEPVRRGRNDSGSLRYVIQTISELKMLSGEDVIRLTNDNVRRVYTRLPAKVSDSHRPCGGFETA